MWFWEAVLAADQRFDLTDVRVAGEWLVGAGHMQSVEFEGVRHPDWNGWGTDTHRLFRHRLEALRSVAARLKGARTRQPRMEPFKADGVFKEYLDRLRLFARTNRSGRNVKPLDKRVFAGIGVQVVVSKADIEELAAEIGKDRPNVRLTLEHLERFWGSAFGSLVVPDITPLCGRCGRDLGTTPTGRRSRAGLCKACRNPDWKEKQGPAKVRRMWRQYKAEERRRDSTPPLRA
jgi:hypothetical protein